MKRLLPLPLPKLHGRSNIRSKNNEQTLENLPRRFSRTSFKRSYFTWARKTSGSTPEDQRLRRKTDETCAGQRQQGGAETTLAAVNRYKAAVGVNAGGFADSRASDTR